MTSIVQRIWISPRTSARFKYCGWSLLSKGLLGIVCLGVIAEGIRLMLPALAMKLHRIPGFAFTKHYEETHVLDIAPFLAFFFMILTWHLLEKAIRFWLMLKPPIPTERGQWNTDREALLVIVIGIVLLAVDCLLFYAASATITWGGGEFAMAPLLATAGYLAVLLGVSYVSAKLSLAVDTIQEIGTLSGEASSDFECPFEKKMAPVLAQFVASKTASPVASYTSLSRV